MNVNEDLEKRDSWAEASEGAQQASESRGEGQVEDWGPMDQTKEEEGRHLGEGEVTSTGQDRTGQGEVSSTFTDLGEHGCRM